MDSRLGRVIFGDENGTRSSFADARNKGYNNADKYLLRISVTSQSKLYRAYVVCLREATLNKASLF